MFVPKGYLLLTTAVDQLAEARRTAGQTNDDGQNAARAELRAELHSGSISTMVISPSSGDTFAIRPQHWAREIALTWLEQGECLLTEDFVDPRPFSMAPSPQQSAPPKASRQSSRALGAGLAAEGRAIFVSEHDCQRLVAKQVVKHETVHLPILCRRAN